MKRLRRWLFNGTPAASLVFCLATTGMWVRSYWRFDLLLWTQGDAAGSDYVLLKLSISSIRGGCTFYIQHNNAKGEASVNDLKNYFTWHPRGFELSSDAVQTLDTMNSAWRMTYRFMPTSPSPFGFQAAANHGLYRGNYYWYGAFAVPYWLPVIVFALLPFLWLLRQALKWGKRNPAACVVCGYDLRATPDRCPECGKTVEKVI
jgi:hypothetical protein